ncbi:MAG: luciferase family protein, partial [Streptosporangiaceae bacterium]
MTGMTDTLAAALCQIEGVAEGDSAFKDGPGFWVNGTEIAHFDGASAIDLRLTRSEIRARRALLRDDPRVAMRSSSSDWLTVEFGTEPDQAFVLELAEVAAAAHRPPPGSTALPPPT